MNLIHPAYHFETDHTGWKSGYHCTRCGSVSHRSGGKWKHQIFEIVDIGAHLEKAGAGKDQETGAVRYKFTTEVWLLIPLCACT